MDNGREPIITIRNLSKSFGEFHILDNVSFDIYRGATTVLLGPSGTGKSTFIKHIVGLHKPDSGEVWVDGQNVNQLTTKELYKMRTKFGLLFQDGALFGSMTVGDNVAFPLRQHTDKSEAEISKIVADSLAMVGLPGVEVKMPNELSGGMRKRVGLARAIVLKPDIVLFDEPTSGLDPVMADAVDKLIKRLQRELNLTFIVISHDVDAAFFIADYIGVLYERNLIAYGPTEEVKNSDHPVVRQFFSKNSEVGPIKPV